MIWSLKSTDLREYRVRDKGQGCGQLLHDRVVSQTSSVSIVPKIWKHLCTETFAAHGLHAFHTLQIRYTFALALNGCYIEMAVIAMVSVVKTLSPWVSKYRIL